MNKNILLLIRSVYTWRWRPSAVISSVVVLSYTVGPLIIESFWAKKPVSTGALEALDDPLVVQTKFEKSGWVPEDITQHL